jgi:hypothetical protein
MEELSAVEGTRLKDLDLDFFTLIKMPDSPLGKYERLALEALNGQVLHRTHIEKLAGPSVDMDRFVTLGFAAEVSFTPTDLLHVMGALELDRLLQNMPEVTEVIYLEVALHCYPQKMKEAIKEQVASIKDKIDILFLGYGYCQSLKGIEDELDITAVMPQMDDCIQILLTPQKYASEIRKEVGTWFITPGWAEAGAAMVIKETHADRVVKYGKDPLEIAKRLFVHYKRGYL